MRKDIDIPEVKGVYVAIVPETIEGVTSWYVNLINDSDVLLTNVLVSSTGYLKKENGEETKTSVLRHMIADLPSKSFAKVESIMEEVFELNNQFWVSFQMNGRMYDKKYIFLSETITEKNFTKIPLIDSIGVLIK
jgi:hypothetical protein